MIDDLDRSIETLLRRELPAEIVSQATITFVTPDEEFPPTSVTLPAIDLFLYDVRENRELRSNEWLIERASDGTATKQRAPVRVDCSYLITAWPSESSTTPAEDEHRLLGEVMRALLRHPTIPDADLVGSLAGQEPPPPATSLQPGRIEDLAGFWQALGGKPKASLHCTVTIAAQVQEPVETGPPVRDKLLRLRLGTDQE